MSNVVSSPHDSYGCKGRSVVVSDKEEERRSIDEEPEPVADKDREEEAAVEGEKEIQPPPVMRSVRREGSSSSIRESCCRLFSSMSMYSACELFLRMKRSSTVFLSFFSF